MLGVWEIGRLIYAQQVVSNAAREGARLAAQGRTINKFGAPTQINFDTGTPNVKDTVYQAVVTGGLPGLAKTDVTVLYGYGGAVSASPSRQPFEGDKNESFRVTVSVPFDKVRWINLGLINPTTVYYRVDWQMLNDDPFNVVTTLPQW